MRAVIFIGVLYLGLIWMKINGFDMTETLAEEKAALRIWFLIFIFLDIWEIQKRR